MLQGHGVGAPPPLTHAETMSWGETMLDIKLVHSAGILLASCPSARPLLVKWREVWMVALANWLANLINSNNWECERLSPFNLSLILVAAVTVLISIEAKAHSDWIR